MRGNGPKVVVETAAKRGKMVCGYHASQAKLAPQAYLRVTSIGIADPMGYVISVVLICMSILAMLISARAMRGKDYATVQRGGGGLVPAGVRDLGVQEHVVHHAVLVRHAAQVVVDLGDRAHRGAGVA